MRHCKWMSLAFATAILLSGCAGSRIGDALRGPDKVAADDDRYCQSIGFKPNTQGYSDCRLTVAQNREDRYALDRMNMRNAGAYLMTQ